MTHPATEANIKTLEDVLEAAMQNGLEGLLQALEILYNEAMNIEWSRYLQASPYEQMKNRKDHPNGYKGERLNTRIGTLNQMVNLHLGKKNQCVEF